jgi:hypothetical protein
VATQEEIDQARALVPDTSLTDEQINAILDGSACLNQAVGKMWGELAGHLSNLVNISEAGSSRSMGDLQRNALSMAKYYSDLGCGETPVDQDAKRTRTRAIVRP